MPIDGHKSRKATMENRPDTQPPPPEPNGAPAPQFVYLQPGQQAVYVQAPPGQPAPSIYYQKPYNAPVQRPPSSGLRISAGIFGIILGFWNLLMLVAMLFTISSYTPPLIGFLIFFHLIGTLAALTLGIMIMAKHRRRSCEIPTMLLGSTVWLITIDAFMAWNSWFPGAALFTLAGGLPTAVLGIIVLAREAAAAKQK
ncbi:hypothetical protein QNO08_17415 (plasmid) [Arthrobacter sp. zg-Y820]|uniref:hypothetical protein n=1 Tax=unclassified Arthrobacter TaxID=235627 RepID=UPI001E4A16CC|nr:MULTISPECIES: hypothetical protein [unclassified Arthrobacter]MCC9198494.1 hypothetical protein [Arthrobacter sp. zg-Y820]MDK1281364.1 hypothetical protein [Arthrobacter sp. zg.Y820]WIB11243.1 hypothetical protein QNO08_17415 [Arthrobacter sp. zg-Y820]